MKFNITGPTYNIPEVSSKEFLSNADRLLRKDVLKPRSIATCNVSHKVAKTPYENHLTTSHPHCLHMLELRA